MGRVERHTLNSCIFFFPIAIKEFKAMFFSKNCILFKEFLVLFLYSLNKTEMADILGRIEKMSLQDSSPLVIQSKLP